MVTVESKRLSDIVERNRRSGLYLKASIAVVAAVVALAGAGFSLAQALREKATDVAMRLAPYDRRLDSIRSVQLSVGTNDAARLKEASVLATRALSAEPLNPQALVALGLAAAARNDVAGARLRFQLSEKFSRRNYPTQIWAIEDAVARGDIDGAMRHYDIALRTTRSATDLLVPILASAISDRQVRESVVRTLLAQPAWGQPFVRYLGTRSPDLDATTSLYEQLRRNQYDFPEGAEASLVDSLIALNKFEAAWRYYASSNGAPDRAASRDPNFRKVLNTASAFDWNLGQSDTISSALQTGEKALVISFDVAAGGGGPILRQLQMLPPGRYRLEGSSIVDAGEGSVQPSWTLKCLEGMDLGSVPIAVGESVKVFSGDFVVPRGCSVQWLTLVVPPVDGLSGIHGEQGGVRLSRVGV